MDSLKKHVLLIGLVMVLPCAASAQIVDGVSFSGFVDASYYGNLNTGDDGFGLDQVELDIIRGSDNGIVLRADLETTGGDGAVCAEQGFLSYTPKESPSFSITLGKFNAPIGFEMLDAPDMYQYSHSLVFDNCLPTNLSGLMGNYQVMDALGIAAYVVNGWDNNSETNDPLSVGGRIGLSLEESLPLSLGVSAIIGKDRAVKTSGDEDLSVFDVDFSLNPTETWLIGGEINIGSVTDNADQEYGWTGLLLMTNYSFGEHFGITLRYDQVSDGDGIVFGDINLLTPELDGQTRSSLTISTLVSLGNGMSALIEYRINMSDEDVFYDKDYKKINSSSGFAFEMTCTF